MYKIPARTLFMGQKLIYVPECHSTNSLLSDLNDRQELPEGTVLITNHQTAGRGQRGNAWEAMPGLNLTFSILLRPDFLEPKDQFRLSMAVSISIAQSLGTFIHDEIKLKWPNDILVNGKKMGGVLIESQLQSGSHACSIVGLGINVNQSQFSFPGAASMNMATGLTYDLNELLQRLLEVLEGEYLMLRNGGIRALKQRYLDYLFRFKEPHQFESDGENFIGTIHDVDEYGRLCMISDGKTRSFSFKEVKFLN